MALAIGAAEAAPPPRTPLSAWPDTYQSFNCIFVHLFCDSGPPPAKPIALVFISLRDCRGSGRFPVVVRIFRSRRIAEVRTMGMADGVTSASVGPFVSDARLAATWTPSGRVRPATSMSSTRGGSFRVVAMRPFCRAFGAGDYDIDGPAVIGPGSPSRTAPAASSRCNFTFPPRRWPASRGSLTREGQRLIRAGRWSVCSSRSRRAP